VIEAFFGAEIFETETGVLAFLRFSFVVLVFTLVHLGLSKIPSMTGRHSSIIAIIFALFTLLIPKQLILSLGQTYVIGIIFGLSFIYVFAIFYIAFKMPGGPAGNWGRFILLGAALFLMILMRRIIEGFVFFFDKFGGFNF